MREVVLPRFSFLEICSNTAMEDETETIPSLRSLCLDYVAKIGTQGVDLLELGKSLPPDCFLDVLERLILWSKISLGLSFNIILALQDFDCNYFLPDTQLHVVRS